MDSDNRCVVLVVAILTLGVLGNIIGYNYIAAYENINMAKAGYQQQVNTVNGAKCWTWTRVEKESPTEK